MNFPLFASAIISNSLWFSRLRKMDDPYEGAISTPDQHYLTRSNTLAAHSIVEIRRIVESLRHDYMINCWHLNEDESAAMWTLYGLREYTIAITTTLKRMINLMPIGISIGQMAYIDYHRDAPLQHNGQIGECIVILTKQKSYRHENEIRMFFRESDGPFVGRHPANTNQKAAGYRVSVNMNHLVDQVYVHSRAEPWFLEVVQNFCAAYKLECQVRQSSLHDTPRYVG